MIELPVTSDELIDRLDEQFPHRCPNPEASEREIWMQVGERRLVDFLIASRDRDERRQAKTNGGPA